MSYYFFSDRDTLNIDHKRKATDHPKLLTNLPISFYLLRAYDRLIVLVKLVWVGALLA